MRPRPPRLVKPVSECMARFSKLQVRSHIAKALLHDAAVGRVGEYAVWVRRCAHVVLELSDSFPEGEAETLVDKWPGAQAPRP